MSEGQTGGEGAGRATPWEDGERYPFAQVEAGWQERWLREQTFATDIEEDGRPKFYALVMFPYPSGAGLHVGHPESYVAADILARYHRMTGHRVLHPMGWDAFGLPAEQYAIQTGTHPSVTTRRNIDNFRRQIQSLGLSYDWNREVNTTDPDYYRWTQWIFLRMYRSWYDQNEGRARPIEELPVPEDIRACGKAKVAEFVDAHRLAYRAEVPVNWCPELGTVLANEEIIDGLSERGGHPVERRPLLQWMLRITAYADRLIEDLDSVDWPEPVKAMQRNWIGKSIGAEIDFVPSGASSSIARPFPRDPDPGVIRVYTTRPDTLFGVTFMVLAPEHPLVDAFATPDQRAAVDAYREEARSTSEIERTNPTREKTGVPTGGFVINPASGEPVPVWIADYVLMGYGTGAIMAVPGHDLRDHEFARMHGLPIAPILAVGEEAVAPGEEPPTARFVRSENEAVSLNGLDPEGGKAAILGWLAASGHGREAANTRLRDWLFSRQRYWGEPFPMVTAPDGQVRDLPDSALPVVLPDLADFEPTGTPDPMLAKATDWVEITDPDTGECLLRETNTMPQWAGSCWYYLRYIDPGNQEELVSPDLERSWMPVDVYIGGAEHAVLHLLYARFWHKVLFDLGCVSTPEPFQKLLNQGMILGEDGEKMSKSRGNVINPDEMIEARGADAFRVYEMFMGPLQVDKPWSTKGLRGASRFLDRCWRAAQFPPPEDKQDPHELVRHRTIRKVTEDTVRVRFNTAISTLMEYVNCLTAKESATREDLRVLTLLLAPYAPHLAEEMWERLEFGSGVSREPWPSFDDALATPELVTIVVQVNGKVRGRIEAEGDTPKDELIALARADDAVARHLGEETPRKVIVVPGRLVNFVL
ncbi:MAG: leucine--tRNA ligase [Gemmatimonadota bacterium]|jgi:leucyl-tRNA synthetase|nr:leucine--tRNA ligase [Gemmatimonadota bacterium]